MQKGKNRENEKGAALVMVIMVTTLLLAVVGGLLLEVSMNTANVTDATAEQQAYNAAESGIQSAINVLRGNTTPSALLDSTKAASDPANLINFRRAVTLSSSNINGDSSTAARLSRWMSYNYPSTSSDRVTLIDSSIYKPISGYAFGVTVTDPDNTGNIVSFSTQGKFYDPATSTWKTTLRIGTAPNVADLTYTPNVVNNLNVASSAANTNFGTFTITAVGAPLVVLSNDLRFEIMVDMSAPYTVSREMRGWIKAGTLDATHPLKFQFDSKIFELMGSTITMDNNPLNINIGSTTTVTGNMTAPEPYRLVISSIGYGPRGARKVLEATIQKNFFNGMSAPATLTLIGTSVGAVFEPGDSAAMDYSGKDVVSSMIIPPIGTTNDANLATVLAKTDGNPPHPYNGNIVGTPSNVDYEMPDWLSSTTNLDKTLKSLKVTAVASGRYYASGVTPTDVGNNATAKGITYVDGDFTLGGSGGGILIVTGKLTLNGNFSFNGLIVVTGANGIDRKGGGNGTLQGNVVVAPYDPSNLNGGFLAPKYDLSGGGNSSVVYNSSSVANGMVAVSNFVLAIAEK